MSWDPAYLKRLRTILANLYLSEADARVVVADIGLPPAEITFKEKSMVIWFSIISEAERRGKIPDLIERCLEDNGENADFMGVYDEYRVILQKGLLDPAHPAATDPYDSYFVNGPYLFIGRPDLRAKLRSLQENTSSRIFLVEGGPVCGKTYTKELIGHAAAQLGVHRYVPCDLDKFIYKPKDVIKTLASKMGVLWADIEKIPDPQEEQLTRHIQELCEWLQAQVMQRTDDDTTWWFVFDGFGKCELLSETKELLVAWAQIVETELRNSCRMVLIDYKNILPATMHAKAVSEVVAVLGRDDYIDFFKRLFKDNGKDHTREDFEIVVEEIERQAEENIVKEADGNNEKLKRLQGQILTYRTMAADQAVKRFMQNGYNLKESANG